MTDRPLVLAARSGASQLGKYDGEVSGDAHQRVGTGNAKEKLTSGDGWERGTQGAQMTGRDGQGRHWL